MARRARRYSESAGSRTLDGARGTSRLRPTEKTPSEGLIWPPATPGPTRTIGPPDTETDTFCALAIGAVAHDSAIMIVESLLTRVLLTCRRGSRAREGSSAVCRSRRDARWNAR